MCVSGEKLGESAWESENEKKGCLQFVLRDTFIHYSVIFILLLTNKTTIEFRYVIMITY